MATPLFELTITIEIDASAGLITGYNYDQNTTAMYNVSGNIINYNGVEANIYYVGATAPFTTTVGGIFTDLHISLPELRQYKVVFVGSNDFTTTSVNVTHFANLIDELLLNRSIDVNTRLPGVPTEYGYPVLELEYNGASLTEYAENRFSDNDIVPYYVDSASLPIDVLISALYLDTDNQSFLMSYSSEINLIPTGEAFVIKDGYYYFTYMSNPGSVKLSSVFMSIKKNTVIGSGIQINIYAGTNAVITPGILATSTVAHINISDSNNITQFELDNELSINGFWVQIIPLNPSSEYEIALASPSFNVALKIARYTRLYDAGLNQGLLYKDVLNSLLTSIYGITYPILVTKMADAVQLNELYQATLGFTTGFDGPCIVCYKDISLIQIADKAITYGSDGYKSIESVASFINTISNYNAFIVLPGNISDKSLYIEYYSPQLNLTTPVAGIMLQFSSLISPSGNDRKITVRSATLMAKYQESRSVLLEEPYVDISGEWRPVITGGHIFRPKFKVGDMIYVDGFGDDTITSVSDSNLGLLNNTFAYTIPVYKVDEPDDYTIVTGAETPRQITKNTFQLSKGPLYINGFNQPAITFAIGPKYQADVSNTIEDWDVENSIFTVNKDIRYDINKFVKYLYIEKGNIISSINLKDSLDSIVDIYIDPYGTIVTAEQGGREYFVSLNLLYILIGSYNLSNLTKPSDIEIRDIRLRGGGLRNDIKFDQAFKKNIGIVGFYDIGFNDGMNIPQMVLAANLPIEIKTRFDTFELDGILHTHSNVGTKIYAQYPTNLYVFGENGSIGLEDGTGVVILEDNSGDILLED